ncbi:MAG: bifunctional homocysteine S-methyltransferase/methylenetetrahydrofolate reductase [candidate division Zixibacteria bacterium]|nr:bifunctional homocysteine S-methyltransferase/methylenetetrahydrofolate reductase [candidate division Zixibacteria bacterium]
MSDLFLERLKKGCMLCDGAMGTLLYSRGIGFEQPFDELNLSKPEMVQKVHQDYIKAGAEIIETNTFGANRFRLGAHGLQGKVKEINLKGAKLAREAREIEGEPVFVAGSIGPLGKPLAPIGKITSSQACEAFQEQAEALLEGGVDLFMIETFSDLVEIAEAIKGVRKVSQLPIVAQMTFNEEGLTLMGYTPFEIAKELERMKVEVVGVNCSVGPQIVLDVIYQMKKATSLRLSAQPNAGFPRFVDGRFIYLSSPEYFAECARKFLSAGVGVVGGCCGTTPQHIRAMAKVLKEKGPGLVEEVEVIEVEKELDEKVTIEEQVEPSTFASRLKEKFVISVELDPPRGVNPKRILSHAQMIKNSGIDAVNIADSPMARVRMSCLSLATLVKEKVGLEVILHLTCRDRNLMGLQSDLMGAHALGIRNILAITGDPPRLGDYPHSTAVYDVDSIGLVKIIKRLNQGTDWAGNSIGSPTSFCIGVGVNPAAPDFEKEMERLKQKVQAGADFIFTQPLYDSEILKKFLKKVEGLNIPILVGLLPLHSFRHAEFLHHEVPGITIPQKTRDRMKQAGEGGIEEGISIAREFLKETKEMISGVYLIPSFGKVELALEVVEGIFF